MSERFSRPIDATTRFSAVYGSPIKHSASPAMQNAGFAALGLHWRYLAFEVAPAALKEAIAGAQSMKFIGLNLTVPHKLLAFSMVDALDQSAKTWGAVNTIRFEANIKGEWLPLREMSDVGNAPLRGQGFNTDADAITRSIREDLDVEVAGSRIVLLGAGGAGRVAALKFAEQGARALYLINRTREKAEEVAAEIQQRFSGVKVTTDYPSSEVDLMVNATSLGLRAEDSLPIDLNRMGWSAAPAVYDMVYRPAETRFLSEAKDAGCRTANGLGMLLYQGAKALEIWTGQQPPIREMREALERNVYGKS